MPQVVYYYCCCIRIQYYTSKKGKQAKGYWPACARAGFAVLDGDLALVRGAAHTALLAAARDGAMVVVVSRDARAARGVRSTRTRTRTRTCTCTGKNTLCRQRWRACVVRARLQLAARLAKRDRLVCQVGPCLPPLFRTNSSALTTFPICYAILMRNHRIIIGNVAYICQVGPCLPLVQRNREVVPH